MYSCGSIAIKFQETSRIKVLWAYYDGPQSWEHKKYSILGRIKQAEFQ